jgi:hypothetical protein
MVAHLDSLSSYQGTARTTGLKDEAVEAVGIIIVGNEPWGNKARPIIEGAMSHVDPLLSGDREIGDCTAVTARQRPASRGMAFLGGPSTKQLNSNRGTVFSVRSLPRCYKQDNWNNELVLFVRTLARKQKDTVGTGQPGNNWQRHSRLRRLGKCCSELQCV